MNSRSARGSHAVTAGIQASVRFRLRSGTSGFDEAKRRMNQITRSLICRFAGNRSLALRMGEGHDGIDGLVLLRIAAYRRDAIASLVTVISVVGMIAAVDNELA